MEALILKVGIHFEHDIVLARQRARHIASLLGFNHQDQVRIGTTVSEIARNAYQYANGGIVEFSLDLDFPQTFRIRVWDEGKGISNLEAILGGQYISKTGMGLGILSAHRLMDKCEVKTVLGQGTDLVMEKKIPQRLLPFTQNSIPAIKEGFARQSPQNPYQEVQRQNQELLATMNELEKQQDELAHVNRELQETNRGVVALYAELEDQAESLKKASKFKNFFFANMTHEFRTPLNCILGSANLLLKRMDGPLNSEQEKQVTITKRAAEDLVSLVNDLLDLAKIEAGKLSIRVETFEIKEMFAMLRAMLRPLLTAESQVSLFFDAPENIPPLHTDEGKLSQIVRNFISNALKFTNRGEIRIMARLESPDSIRISVADPGIGIAPEDHARIFEEFVQVEGPHQENIKGTGLGLSLSRKLAELLGGTVSVESELGKGSVFSVIVPRVCAAISEEPAENIIVPSVVAAPSTPSRKPLVVIIDDDEKWRYLLRSFLQSFDCEVMEAVSGEAGVHLIRQEVPNMVILDLNMPGLNGYGVLEQMNREPKLAKVSVLVNTSQLLNTQENSFLGPRVAGYVSKQALAADPIPLLEPILNKARISLVKNVIVQ